MNFSYILVCPRLAHLCLAYHERDIGKQYRQYILTAGISINMVMIKTHYISFLLEMGQSKELKAE